MPGVATRHPNSRSHKKPPSTSRSRRFSIIFSRNLKPGSRESFVHGSGRSLGRQTAKSESKSHPIPTMKTSQDFQKLSAGVSLVILALGFLLIGLMSLRATPAGESIALSAMSCIIGAWASMAVAGVFLFAAFAYWQRNSFLSPRSPAGADSYGVGKPASCPKSQESAVEAFAGLAWVSQT
jgi:hypothetical protein